MYQNMTGGQYHAARMQEAEERSEAGWWTEKHIAYTERRVMEIAGGNALMSDKVKRIEAVFEETLRHLDRHGVVVGDRRIEAFEAALREFIEHDDAGYLQDGLADTFGMLSV